VPGLFKGLLARFSTPGGFSLEQVLALPSTTIASAVNTVVGIAGGVPVLGTAVKILNGIGLFEIRTRRPDSDELPKGTQWLDKTPDAGVLRFWPGSRGVDWTGEILATSPGNVPVACWDYARQTFDPISVITRQGICIFHKASEHTAQQLDADHQTAKRVFSVDELSAAKDEARQRGYEW